MSYRIVTDSTCDYTPEMKTWNNISSVPLQLQLGDYKIMDDENFDQADFIKRMKEYEDVPRSACPSIDSWMRAYDCDEDEIFVITITSKLSGTYNSAVQAASLFAEEKDANKKIHVFDGKATSVKSTLIALKIKELKDNGASFEEVVEKITKYIDGIKLYFLLDSLENLRKNGRLSNLQASLLKALRVKLICKETDANIEKLTQDVSIGRAASKLAKIMNEDMKQFDTSKMTFAISHCFCKERAEKIINEATQGTDVKETMLLNMGGLNTLYADEGGIIVAYDTYFI